MSTQMSDCQLYDRRKKRSISLQSALLAALLALLVFNPWTFGLVNGVTGGIFGKQDIIVGANGRPTAVGLIVHTLVLFLLGLFVFYASMNPNERARLCCVPSVQLQMN